MSTFWAWVCVILVIAAAGFVLQQQVNPSGNDCSFAANNGDPLPASCAP